MDYKPDRIGALIERLSLTANVSVRGNSDWDQATQRWTDWCRPGLDIAVEVATEEDVAATVSSHLIVCTIDDRR